MQEERWGGARRNKEGKEGEGDESSTLFFEFSVKFFN